MVRFSSLNVLVFGLLLRSVDGACAPESPVYSDTPLKVVERDVVIIGGGAAGAYAAVRLKDEGKTVAIVERSIKLGGHVNTMWGGNGPIDYGVQAYISNNETVDFFGRFNVNLTSSGLSTLPSKLVDFVSGHTIPNGTATNPYDFIGPIINYLTTISTQFPFLATGAYNIPNPVPEDLLLPFGDFLGKYNLTEVVPVVWIFAQGVGNLMEATTLNVLQNFGQPHIEGLISGYLAAPGGNQAVFDAAEKFIGTDNIFFLSTANKVTRNGDSGVEVTLQGVTIKAKKLLVTIPPTIANLAPFDLSESETSIFSKWQKIPYYVGVTTGTDLADLTNYLNTNTSSPYGLPSTPFVWRFESVGQSGYQTIKVIGEPDSDAAKSLVTDALSKITGNSTATLAAWEEHDNLQLHFTPEEIRSGAYKDLYALQGQSNTYWAGNAWCSDYSPLIWAFIENTTLPALLA
ncbi:unnamed protein product [Discula destructiva]